MDVRFNQISGLDEVLSHPAASGKNTPAGPDFPDWMLGTVLFLV